MTNVLTVKNFRSIKDAEIELGIFTVLNGENNSGKSSFLYALQVMKNIVSNPNQTVC
jgi:AAA15 family ATPase/GTPase